MPTHSGVAIPAAIILHRFFLGDWAACCDSGAGWAGWAGLWLLGELGGLGGWVAGRWADWAGWARCVGLAGTLLGFSWGAGLTANVVANRQF